MGDEACSDLGSLLALWPIASSLTEHLPVGDLITLARLSVTLRAVLHGFARPPENDPTPAHSHRVREDLRIGQHATNYWQRLKSRAPFECSSRTHTKGSAPKPCRYCSRPICAACIVRSSFARGHENTFQNRTRCLCKACWESGNSSRSHTFPLYSSEPVTKRKQWHDPHGSTKDYCTCTLKDDGWLCLECKDLQNWEAISSAETICHGKNCGAELDPDKERRRICLWCDRALPMQIGGTTRHHWNQKMIEARARNAASRQADLEEYNRRRLRLMRMSRREMRGDEAVKDDPDADTPQFVRHLDTINYRSYMDESAAPTGDNVYDSKRGYWRYSLDFVLKIGARCRHIPMPPQLADVSEANPGGLRFARKNAEKTEDIFSFTAMVPSMSKERLKEWCTLKPTILELLLVQKLSYEETQSVMQKDYDFHASIKEYRKVLHLWYSQGHIDHYRRGSSLGREDAPDHGQSPASAPASATDDTGLERIPTLNSNSDLASSDERQLRRTTTGTSTRTFSSFEEGEIDPVRVRLSRSTDALKRKMEQYRPSFSWGGEQHSASAAAVPQPSREESTDILTRPQSDDLAPGLDSAVLDPAENGEDPPPYSPDGWIWP
ncbi:hypothetical protein LTR67_007757 [Exophiala xenobiotica]